MLEEQLGDYAAVLTACHGLGIRTEARPNPKMETIRHLERLMERYPDLLLQRDAVTAAFWASAPPVPPSTWFLRPKQQKKSG